jgi:hypothetical protein
MVFSYCLKKTMMKTIKITVLAAGIALMFSSCAMVKAPLTGMVYTSMNAPLAVTSNSGSSKVGSAKASSLLGIIATGDASVDAACKAAGITKIHHVDEKVSSILGIIATYEVMVYGE